MSRLEKILVRGYFAFWGFYFSYFWLRSIYKDSQGNLIVNSVNMWGDWAIHFTMGSAMAFRELIPLESPLLVGAPFRYPFFVNWLSALLIRAGLPFYESFTWPSLLMCLFAIYALYAFFKELLKSPGWAVAASFLFLFNGGWGIFQFIKEIVHSPQHWNTLLFPPEKYTRLEDLHIHWISVIDSMLIPQRAFQLGLPVGLLILRNLLFPTPRRLWAAGVLMGFMPIIHAHTFLSLVIITACWCFWEVAFEAASPKDPLVRKWAVFWGPAVLLAVPLALFYVLPGGAASGIEWKPGWYAAEKDVGWFEFWWMNWGLTPFAALAGLALLVKDSPKRIGKLSVLKVYFPFLLVFALLNLFLFQRWIWDNTKLLVWASVGFVALAVYLLKKLPKAAAVALFILLAASGAVDAYRVQIVRLNRYQMYSKEELQLADWVRKNTDKDSVWLTGTYHNNWLFNLTGRRALLTYEGWMWTHGYDYGDVKDAVVALFADPSRRDILQKYKVDYAVIGPSEQADLQANSQGFNQEFNVAAAGKETKIFAVDTGQHPFGGRPDSAVIHLPLALSEVNLVPGLLCREYKGAIFVGDVLIKPVDAIDALNFSSSDPKPFEPPYSLVYEGYLQAPADGVYTLRLESDDGSWLWLDDSMVINNGGSHGVMGIEGGANLKKGFHKFRLAYFDGGGGAILKVQWKGPSGTDFQELSPKVFFRKKD